MEEQDLALSCDESYISLLLSDPQDLENDNDDLMSDENYAEKLQLQEAIVSSLTTAPPPPPTKTMEIGESSKQNDVEVLCGICADTKRKSDFFPIQNCAHDYCTTCIATHVSTKIQMKTFNTSHAAFPCPGVDCEGLLNVDTCRAVVPPAVLSAWDTMICEAMISQSQKFYCPYNDCSELLVNDGEVVIREAECPFCHRLFCANCRAPWHHWTGCDEYLKLGVNEREREDIMVHQLAKKNKWQRCPSCKYFVEKKDGCLHMTCKCHFEFCYACGKRWSSTHGGCQ